MMALGQKPTLEENMALFVPQVEVLCNTRGEAGSVIFTGGERYDIPAEPIAGRVLDLTGAGDLYAAGVLYGLTHGWNPGEAGVLGSKCAADIIQQMGPRCQQPLKRHVA